MDTLQAILLGIVQGITEFLPVSSSGHLQIAKELLGVELEENLTFDVALHAATVLSTIVVLWSEVWRLLKGLFSRRFNAEQAYVLKLVLSMIPIGFVGFLFKDRINALLDAPYILVIVGAMLLLTAALLAFAYYAKPRQKETISYRDAFIIGHAGPFACGHDHRHGPLAGQQKSRRGAILVPDGAGSDSGRDAARSRQRRPHGRRGRRSSRRRLPRLVRHGLSGLQIHDRNRQAGQTHLVRALLRRRGPRIHPKLFLLMKEPIDLRGLNFEEGYIAVLDKPLRWTSTDVVRKIKFTLRRLGYRKIKVGHAGTLDPLATGILLVCIGRATKMVDALQAEEKEYVADVMLGATTPSYDLEHPVDRTFPTEHITREKVLAALSSLTGERLQEPPVYSAKKIDGTRAYELARAGEEVTMRKATVNIYELELLEYDLPRIRIRVRCSKGTYIRSLAHEIGQALASGAHLTSLRRTRSGGFTLEKAFEFEEFLKKLQELETK